MTVRHGYEYSYPLNAVVTTAHPGTFPAEHSFASVSPENVVLTAVKKAEDAKGLLPRVRVGRQGCDGGVPCAAGPGERTVHQPAGDAGGQSVDRHRRRGQGPDSSLRDSDHPS